ncbi:hypothetical protein B7P43_G08936 [Cryptotermes secundus]|uniref:BED-type domain-containing protein n=1 Tax=Cryptotermes secundus TaxID=105785 RepID=A0A2J7PEG5_9NEOP|nr:hypothetical protein B7P43_G08936 [Cryptotermes secundus]
MNKRQGTLFNFGVKKSRIEGVCDATSSDSSTSSLHSDLQDVQNEGKTTSTQKKKSASIRKYMDSYLKFGFIQCPNTDQLPQPQCVICATVLGNEAKKPSRLTRHLNTRHSDLVNKPIEFFMRKRDALKVEKKIIYQASTTDTSLLTASYLMALQIAKYKKSYSIGEELIKPSLIAACNEVLGQSAASKMKDIPLSNDTVGRRISDMAEDTETIAMAKAAFSKKKNLFTSKLDLNLRKKLVKCYIWSIALYGAETWTLRAVDQKHLESFEMWCWRRMEKISWTDYVRNEEVLIRVSEQRNILHEIRKRKANWIGHVLRRNCLLKEAIEGKIDGRIEVTRRRGRRRKKMLDDLGDRRGYCHLKEKALDRIKWRNCFERDCGPVVLTDY